MRICNLHLNPKKPHRKLKNIQMEKLKQTIATKDESESESEREREKEITNESDNLFCWFYFIIQYLSRHFGWMAQMDPNEVTSKWEKQKQNEICWMLIIIIVITINNFHWHCHWITNNSKHFCVYVFKCFH